MSGSTFVHLSVVQCLCNAYAATSLYNIALKVSFTLPKYVHPRPPWVLQLPNRGCPSCAPSNFKRRSTFVFAILFRSPLPPIYLTRIVSFQGAYCSIRRRASCACPCLNPMATFPTMCQCILTSFVPLVVTDFAVEFKTTCNTRTPHVYLTTLQSTTTHVLFSGPVCVILRCQVSCPISSFRRMPQTAAYG